LTSAAHKMVLRANIRGISIEAQVHEGPPDACIRRPSSFLLIPVG
jgi:hypothetical protein